MRFTFTSAANGVLRCVVSFSGLCCCLWGVGRGLLLARALFFCLSVQGRLKVCGLSYFSLVRTYIDRGWPFKFIILVLSVYWVAV